MLWFAIVLATLLLASVGFERWASSREAHARHQDLQRALAQPGL